MTSPPVCRLCGQGDPIDSHIISRFFWKNSGIAHRSDGEGFDFICEAEPQWTEHNKQSGFQERILCKVCDNNLRSSFEDYMARQIYGKRGILRSPQTGHRIIENVSYEKVKLFSMFNLFMMGVSNHPYYRAVSLGSKHEDKLRRMLLAKDPGKPWEYFAICFRLRMNGKTFEGMSLAPQRVRWQNGQVMYRFVCAGLCWMITCSSHFDNWLREPVFIGLDGKMIVFDGNPTDIPFIRERMNNWLVTNGHPPLAG